MVKKINNRPGFVRVLIPARNKTIQIRQNRARDPKFMNKHGLILITEPQMPATIPQPVTPIAPFNDPSMLRPENPQQSAPQMHYMEPNQPAKTPLEPMKPAKVSTPKTK